MIIVLLGPPGSGKGTQAQFLAEKIQLPHLSTGDMFRQMIADGTEEGTELNEYMIQGKLAPSEIVNKIVEKFLAKAEYNKGCILDGYPRNMEQAKFLEKINKSPLKVIYFEVDEQIVVKRILGRFNCKDCGKIYNSYYAPPIVDKVCNDCGSQHFVYREDDDKETILKRIVVYKNEVYPLVDYYRDKGVLYAVDASKNKEEVSLQLSTVLKRI